MTDREIWLTLIAHADRLGVVTRCPISTLADYARVRPAQARAAIQRLHGAGLLNILKTSGKRAHYHLLGTWRADRDAARRFVESEGERVRSLQNRRTRLYEVAKSDHPLGPDLRVTDLDTSNEKVIKFTLRINGIGYVRNCVILQRQDGTHYFGEPAKRIGSSWEKTCNVDPTLASEAIDAALRPRPDTPMRQATHTPFSISNLQNVQIDKATCRWRVRFTLDIPGVIQVRDCAVMEQTDGTRIVVGPAKNVGGKWLRIFVVDHELANQITKRVLHQRAQAV